MTSRQRIEIAAQQLGIKIYQLDYRKPVILEMGDGLGGWFISTNVGMFGHVNADGLIERIREVHQQKDTPEDA